VANTFISWVGRNRNSFQFQPLRGTAHGFSFSYWIVGRRIARCHKRSRHLLGWDGKFIAWLVAYGLGGIVFDLVGLVEHLRNPLLAISEMRRLAVAGEMAMVCQRSEAAGQRSFNDAKYEIQCLRIDCSSAELSSYAGEISGNAFSTSIRTNPRIRDSALLLNTSVHRLL
jgi:hypothetical protein